MLVLLYEADFKQAFTHALLGVYGTLTAKTGGEGLHMGAMLDQLVVQLFLSEVRYSRVLCRVQGLARAYHKDSVHGIVPRMSLRHGKSVDIFLTQLSAVLLRRIMKVLALVVGQAVSVTSPVLPDLWDLQFLLLHKCRSVQASSCTTVACWKPF